MIIKAKSLATWVDLTDNHEYHKDDSFPHDGRSIDKKRINELKSNENSMGYPLIEIEEIQNKSNEEVNK